MVGGKLQDREAPHAVPDSHDGAKAQLIDDVRDIIRIGRDGIRTLRFVALSVPAQVDSHDPVPPGEVLNLRSEERAIARPPVYEHEGWFARASVLIGQLRPLVENCRHTCFSFFSHAQRTHAPEDVKHLTISSLAGLSAVFKDGEFPVK